MAQEAVHSRPMGTQPLFKIVAEAPGIIRTSVDEIISIFECVAVDHLDRQQIKAVLEDRNVTMEAIYQSLVEAATLRDGQGDTIMNSNGRPQLVSDVTEWGLKQQAITDHAKFVRGAKTAMYQVLDCVELKDGLHTTVLADTEVMQALENIHMKTMAARLATILASGTSGNRRPLARYDELNKLINMRRESSMSLEEYRVQLVRQRAHLKALGVDLSDEIMAEIFMVTSGDEVRVMTGIPHTFPPAKLLGERLEAPLDSEDAAVHEAELKSKVQVAPVKHVTTEQEEARRLHKQFERAMYAFYEAEGVRPDVLLQFEEAMYQAKIELNEKVLEIHAMGVNTNPRLIEITEASLKDAREQHNRVKNQLRDLPTVTQRNDTYGPSEDNLIYAMSEKEVLALKDTTDEATLFRVCLAAVSDLQMYMTNASVARKACVAIQILSLIGDANRARLLRCGAFDAVMSALDTHTTNVYVVEHAFAAIRNLSIKHTECVIFVRPPDCDVIMTAMKAHMFNANVAEHACSSIRNLSFDMPHSASILAHFGACEVVIKAMRVHSTHGGVAEEACGAIQSLSYNSPENRALLLRCGACEKLVFALLTHKASALVSEVACGAIWNLCSDTACKSKLVQLNAKLAVASCADNPFKQGSLDQLRL